jgi:chromate reductase
MTYMVAALCGSLRKDSYNRKLLGAFRKLAPKDVLMRDLDIGALPLFNEDLEADLPKNVRALHEGVDWADGVLLITPEYNRSYSPVIKNALDWGSLPAGKNHWDGKPAAVAGCTPYALGAFGAQNHLRQVLMYLNMPPLQQPEFYLSGAKEKFDAQSELVDGPTAEKIRTLWQAFLELIDKMSGQSGG